MVKYKAVNSRVTSNTAVRINSMAAQETLSMDGNAAVAEAVKQVNPDVVVAHPVTPAAGMIDKIASFVADGHLETEMVNVESGGSALSGCIGASAAGGRVFTATASQELASMHETLFIASSLRLPLVMGIANRSLAAPANYRSDHSDTSAQRDCGWVQFYCDSPQEAYDNLIQAYKVAEHTDVRTPVMVAMDGWETSGTPGTIVLEDTEEIGNFVGKCSPSYSLLDSENPISVGVYSSQDYYFEHKANQLQGIHHARKVIKDVGKEFGDRFGRYYGYFESYKMEDADTALLLMNSPAIAAKETVDDLRSQGENVGLLKLRVFRPFPYNELSETLSGLKAVAVLDRVFAPGTLGGPLFIETRSALYNISNGSGNGQQPMIFPYIYGLGGRNIDKDDLELVYKEIKEKYETAESVNEVKFINLRQ